MTQQKWEPGTVALVTTIRGKEFVGIRRDAGPSYWVGSGAHATDSVTAKIRPLLVLDPDDPDQMRELWEGWRDSHSPNGATAMTEAVRAMLPKPTPVKPAEPTGLGAVVEDADGDFWVYGGMRSILDGETRIWLHAEKKDTYAKINAVKVLSEGVTR